MQYIDEKNGLVWTRSADHTEWTNDKGAKIICAPETSFEQMLNAYNGYLSNQEAKTDAERIAELEAQLAALLSKLS